MDPISQSNAGAVADAGPDVLAACALSSVPGVGASTLARIADRFHSLREAVDEGPGRLLEQGDDLRLNTEAREYLGNAHDDWRYALAKNEPAIRQLLSLYASKAKH